MEHVLQSHILESIRKLLIDKGMTQLDLSAQMDLSRQMISKYLTNRTELTINMFQRFCEALSVSPNSIVANFVPPEAPWFVNEPPLEYKTVEKHTLNIYKNKIRSLETNIKHLEKIEILLERQYMDKCKRVDELERDLQKCDEELENARNKRTA